MRHCYLHIGTHKTGTSSIQRVLATQPKVLQEAGYIFPLAGRFTDDSGQHGLAQQSNSDELGVLVETLITEISGSRRHVILSSEEFSHMLWRNASGFQHLVNRLSSVVDKIVVILYLRKQAGFIESNYVERLKSGFCLDFSTYAQTRLDTELAEFPLDYRKLIARLDDSSGIELIVRDYDAVRSSSVLPGFLDIIGWPREIALTEERVNTGDPLVDALKNFCRAQLQRKLTNADERLIELIDASIPVRPRMSGKTLRSYVRHFASCNRELAQRFGLPSLVEEPPPERAFGEWRGLGSAPPPDDGMQPVVTLDNLFSKDFVAVVTAAAQRFALMDAALADARMIAGQRLNEIEDLRSRLARAEQHELASAAPEPPPSLPPGEAPEPPPTLRACASAFRAWALYRLRA